MELGADIAFAVLEQFAQRRAPIVLRSDRKIDHVGWHDTVAVENPMRAQLIRHRTHVGSATGKGLLTPVKCLFGINQCHDQG